MSFKKSLISRQAQSIVEYILIFIVLAMSALFVFRSFDPDKSNLPGVFGKSVTNVLAELKK